MSPKKFGASSEGEAMKIRLKLPLCWYLGGFSGRGRLMLWHSVSNSRGRGKRRSDPTSLRLVSRELVERLQGNSRFAFQRGHDCFGARLQTNLSSRQHNQFAVICA